MSGKIHQFHEKYNVHKVVVKKIRLVQWETKSIVKAKLLSHATSYGQVKCYADNYSWKIT